MWEKIGHTWELCKNSIRQKLFFKSHQARMRKNLVMKTRKKISKPSSCNNLDPVQVNGHRLLGMNHIEVVSILKDLPVNVRMVCARRSPDSTPYRLIDTSQDKAAFAARVRRTFLVYSFHFSNSEFLILWIQNCFEIFTSTNVVSLIATENAHDFSWKLKTRTILVSEEQLRPLLCLLALNIKMPFSRGGDEMMFWFWEREFKLIVNFLDGEEWNKYANKNLSWN